MWPLSLTLTMTLTLNFQGQIWNFLYLSQKWSDCHETKSKHIDWTPGLNVTIWFDLHHNLDLWILKVKHDLDLWPHTWPSPWIFMVKFWNTCIPEWEGRLTLHKGVGSRSFMTMTMTIWWPRSGVWIYQIVTGVTSVVGVPSTHLVFNTKLSTYFSDWYFQHITLHSGAVLSRWMTQDLIKDKSILVLVMAWCHHATSHYLKQCQPSFFLCHIIIMSQIES